eukprot:1254344-Amphidinium_carterae.2
MASRSFVHFFNLVLPGQAMRERRKMEWHKRSMAKLLNKQPHKITGRHAYFAELMRTRAFRMQDKSRSGKEFVTEKMVLQRHGQYWSRMSDDKRAVYEAQASSMIAGETARIAVKWEEHYKAHKDLESQQKKHESGSMGEFRLKRCKLTDNDMSALTERVAAIRSKHASLESSGLHGKSPEKIDESVYRKLEAESPLPSDGTVNLSRTGRLLARMREVLSQAVLVLDIEGQAHYFRFVYAGLHGKGELVLLPLECLELPPSNMSVSQFLGEAKNPPSRLWAYEAGTFDRQLGTVDFSLDELGVFQKSVFKAPGLLAFSS